MNWLLSPFTPLHPETDWISLLKFIKGKKKYHHAVWNLSFTISSLSTHSKLQKNAFWFTSDQLPMGKKMFQMLFSPAFLTTLQCRLMWDFHCWMKGWINLITWKMEPKEIQRIWVIFVEFFFKSSFFLMPPNIPSSRWWLVQEIKVWRDWIQDWTGSMRLFVAL